MLSREHLLNIIKQHVQKGEFTLASGKKSDYYLDLRPVLMRGDALATIVEHLSWQIPVLRPRRTELCFAGIGFAGHILVSAFVSMWGALGRGVVVRTDKKDHGIERQIVSGAKVDQSIVLVDDVATSGGSLLKLYQKIAQEDDRLHGCQVVGALAILDRGEGAAEALEGSNIPFKSLFHIEEVL